MADIPSNIPGAPQGAEPMKKSTGKVQPKKETVRINLPPKPSAAPTIKLPTLPPGASGVPGVAAPAAAPAASAAAAPAAPRPALTSTASAPKPTTAAAQQPRPMAPAAVAPRVATLSPVDKGLAIAAAVVGLVAVGTTAYLAFMF
jgi:hypothetical protein